ncbi:HNH endonuclease [Desulfofundulus kuznetsovii DSM 6115]|uniref:HNH endonuclease n=1 Tax=Desulfofundulus kuznetsovii (strain DSM 6115 / VKM B-1805 / 17) TaxID=760568 RepID=A0AAU8P938_DESK7|nr:HNH endonuclease [Desulfofundulus kuznetsovii DSM 6115]
MAPAFAGHSKVFVVDAEGKPLLPCHPARARKLLKVGKVEVLRGSPFTIRLKYPVENPVGSLRAKVDDGSKWVGIALVNEHTGEVVFRGTLIQRGDVVRLLTLRREYRRNRRYRLVRHRECRNHNRKQLAPFPSIRQKKEAVCRVLTDLAKIAPISGVDVELVAAGVKNPALPGEGAREKVLNRDGACVLCGSEEKLQRHHLVPRSKGGSDTPMNQVVLCEKCHRKIHAGEVSLDREGWTFAWVAHAVLGKAYLLALLSRFGKVRMCEGWRTKEWREGLGLAKSHANDAACLFPPGGPLKIFGPEYLIYPLRRRKWEGNPTKTCEERSGFQHWDIVRAERAGRRVFGCVRSLKARAMTLRTAGDGNFEVSYSKAKLLHRPRGLAYVPVW